MESADRAFGQRRADGGSDCGGRGQEPALIVIEPELVFGGLKTVLDRPTMAFDRDQRFDGCSCRAPGGEEGKVIICDATTDQQTACPQAVIRAVALIEAHVLGAERLHGDDTHVPILAKGKTIKGHIWTYVRDDRPFGGRAPPAALYYASRDRRHEHPLRHLKAFSGILQADAYGGYNELYDPARAEGPITSALCWAHARRQFFELADIAANARRGKNAGAISPMALEAVRRIDALFEIERASTA